MKIYFLFIGIVINLNILQIYPNCNPHNVIGVCRAYWAYSISDLFTIQKCIKNDGILENKYSPQVLVNNVVSDNNQECYTFNQIDSMEKGLKYAQVMGIGKEQETPDVSYYLGSEYPDKIVSFEEIQSVEVEREMMENQNTPILVMKNSIELMFNDASATKVVTNDDNMISFVIIGFDIVQGHKVFILQNNFNDNWTDNGFTQINQNDPNIVKIYKVDINQF